MATAISETKKRILDLAQQYIQTRGFNGFSYKDIAEKMGIRKASIHHHFASKEELVFQVIHRYRRWFEKWIERTDAATSDFWPRLDAFFQIYKDMYYAYDMNCPVTVLSAEMETLPERVQHELKLLFNDMHSWLHQELIKAETAKLINSGINVEIMASTIISTITGFSKYHRLSNDQVSLDQIAEQLKTQMRV